VNIRPETFRGLVAEVASLREDMRALKKAIAEGALATRAPNQDPTIDGFCSRHGISRNTFLNWRRAGLAPAETRVSRRVIITPEAESEWLMERALRGQTRFVP
jgi:transposase-like protein